MNAVSIVNTYLIAFAGLFIGYMGVNFLFA